MYCIKCGIKLGDTEKVCPLCNTSVYHPDIFFEPSPANYPDNVQEKQRISKKGVVFILTMLLAIPILTMLLVDIKLSGGVGWSGISALAIVLGYCFFLLPLWFKKPNLVIFLPIDFALSAGYLLYLDLYFNKSSWFLTLALPLCVLFCLVSTAALVLLKYLKKGKLFVWSGIFYFAGLSCVLIEHLISLTFSFDKMFVWSLYPLIACVLSATAILVIAICKPMRESLEKRFFI